MKPLYLSEITTKDGLIHQGMFFTPQKPKKKALLWIHGLTGKFYSNVKMMEAFAEACEKEGFGFAAFNTRGHDMVTGAHKVDSAVEKGYSHTMIGAGVEKFEECILDIEAGIDFLGAKGFTEIFLVGSSTGANKAAYFGATAQNSRVAGIILLSPISDRLSKLIQTPWYKIWYLQLLVALGRGDKLIVGHNFFPGTPRRFLSIVTPGSSEDIFTYGDTDRPLDRFSSIKKPIFIVFGGNDEHADRPVESIKKIFDARQKSSSYKSSIIANTNHSFDGKEKEVVYAIMSWVKDI